MAPRENGSHDRATRIAIGIVATAGVESVLQAVQRQTGAPELRVVIADSGVDPQVSAIVRTWTRESNLASEVIDAPATVLGARNAILDAVVLDQTTRTWVTFPEPGDTFDSDYFKQAASFFTADSVVVATRQYQWDTTAGEAVPHVQLDEAFADGTAVTVNVTRSPEMFPIVMRTAFMSSDAIVAQGLRFDPRLESGFGDLDFLCRLLAVQSSAVVRFVDVPYRFAVRDDVATAGARYFSDPSKFTTILEVGHLRLLKELSADGVAPEFVQHAVLFDLGWYFRGDEALSSQMNAEMHGVEDDFHELVSRILESIDPAVLEGLSARRLPLERYVAWRYGYAGTDWHAPIVTLSEIDVRRGLVCLSYFYVGATPSEELRLDGDLARPLYVKSRDVIYAGRTLASERIMWVPSSRRVTLHLAGALVPLSKARPQRAHTRWSPHELKAALVTDDANAPMASSARALASRYLGLDKVRSWVIRAIAKSEPVKRRYGASWVLMDRVDAAHDNAEHLFKYLRRKEPDRPVWFALDRKSKDYARLKREGVGNLLAYGSLKWKLVCLNATHVLSSQAGPYVDNPQSLRSVRRPRWRFVFLQHGVVHTGLHRWLNRRRFDLFLTSTSDEYAAIVGDRSPYRFTPHEVALTGMPRFDRLFQLAEAVNSPGAIVVAPTWRESLFSGKADSKGLRAQRSDFYDSEYAKQWREFLSSRRLGDIARTAGKRVDFMPHPNIKPYLDQFDLPAYVNVLSYETHDVQRVLADAAVLVTDYSSVAFDAAFISRPVVYFQFDRTDVFRGAHTVRQGYFSYDEDGFGPVVRTADAVVDAIAELSGQGFVATAEYRDRMETAFPFHDDEACQRVVEAVSALDARVKLGQSIDLPLAPPPRPSPRD